MKKILFPTDFSIAANNALWYAIDLAKSIGAEIDLMHVYSVPFREGMGTTDETMTQLLESKKEEILKKMDILTSDKPPKYFGGHLLIYGLFTAIEIIDTAKNNKYDWIIMGMQGEHSNLEKTVGSVTSKVLMRSTCPVMAVPEKAKFKGINTVGYATHFDLKDQHAYNQLLEFVEAMEANLHLIHVDTVASKKVPVGNIIEADFHPLFDTKVSIINNPSAVKGLNALVANNNIDALALYIPYRRIWERLFYQSISKQMTFHTEIPLLVFHG